MQGVSQEHRLVERSVRALTLTKMGPLVFRCSDVILGLEQSWMMPRTKRLEEGVCKQYGAKVVGRLPEILVRCSTVFIEKRLKPSAVVKICEFASENLFGAG